MIKYDILTIKFYFNCIKKAYNKKNDRNVVNHIYAFYGLVMYTSA